jgi:hypothetical protein
MALSSPGVGSGPDPNNIADIGAETPAWEALERQPRPEPVTAPREREPARTVALSRTRI